MERKLKMYLLIGSLVFVVAIVAERLSKNRDEQYEFAGIIDKIEYNEKKTPSIIVKGQHYVLSTNWRFNDEMKVGDSLLKEKGSTIYKLIKRPTGKVILSKQ